ncbi:MAG TPA: 1-phosphofructokinase family hexose kinase [Pyrinomonadaceae bacterium]|jgi:tagatose 6-phosphate kinase|nr:1-phosphofructokinase family hexose kinase [Pyrinomonadaceae bacterium]
MILIVNLNLAVDHLVEVDELRAGEVQRSLGERRQVGGKGVNVARVLKTLCEPSRLLGFTGGSAGELIEEGLRAEGIKLRSTRVRGESRTCLIINDRSRREQTVINAPGASIGDEEFRRFETGYARSLPGAEFVVITGSLPPNLPADTYAQLIEAARSCGKRVLLDCAGAPLRLALEARPFLVKINGAEASELLHAPAVTDFDGAARATRELRGRGAESAMITLGAQGAVLDSGDARYRFDAPRVAAANSVGSGDATLAGLAFGLRRGWTMQESGALAVAAGAANALHGAGACSKEEIAELQPRVRCEVEKF